LNLWIRASPDFKYILKRKDGFLDTVVELIRIILNSEFTSTSGCLITEDRKCYPGDHQEWFIRQE